MSGPKLDLARPYTLVVSMAAAHIHTEVNDRLFQTLVLKAPSSPRNRRVSRSIGTADHILEVRPPLSQIPIDVDLFTIRLS